MMLMLCCGFLFLTHFICHANPRKCSQYQNEDRCKKCEPGERMESRCTDSCPTLCVQCPSDYYMDEPSYEMVCKRCTQCSKEHMVYKVSCSKSTDAVCDCESGYKCNGMPCTTCEKIPTTAPPTTPAPTTTTTTTAPTTASSSTVTCTRKRNEHPISPSQDILWITLSLCCVCILLTCFILITRPTRACGWIMLASVGSFLGSKKTSANSSQCTEDEEVPMPVQEVCGHKLWEEEI
ncbi:tumor necrosis factor receptor superfamily member 8 isoform X2 [Neoarius graeffei]|uniref:tumor necrosis factor receptor superfamily member 8 isoform X2 n=1 Tax=Neoarius graeffei TaxID=443677 RepID=UPI00298CA04B|nr:tumor necrosis factor receptor superfamily member 8 isoform X2 [Neoarius graeffei]